MTNAEIKSSEQAVSILFVNSPCSIVLPAGCGKTELIALLTSGLSELGHTVLLLTHTHAGVAALNSRLTKYNVNTNNYYVKTIDRLALNLIAAFPQESNTPVPDTIDWSDASIYHSAAQSATEGTHFSRLIASSYSALIVDEYQDCIRSQHDLIVSLSKSIPTVLFGDPLQGLFGFTGHSIDWETDVLPTFPAIGVKSLPYRWIKTNSELGIWLARARDTLLNRDQLNLSDAPVR